MENNTDSKQDESFIQDSPEVTLGETVGWTDKILSSLPAFKSRNYTLYFIGQLISMIGTWLQIVAEGWLIFQLSHSAYYVGLSTAASMVPSLFLSLIGGVIADRYPKKRVILITQSLAMTLAFTLGILTITHTVTVWHIIFLAFLLGIVQAVDITTRQSYVVELVNDKKLLPSAIALNSTIYNGARVIGPTIAGLLISSFGLGMAFILNGISYIAVITALLFIHTNPVTSSVHQGTLKAIKEGVHYAFAHPTIKSLLVSTVFMSVFGWSYSTLMPVIAENVFHLNAAGLGYMYAATGVGALLGTVLISSYGNRINANIFIAGGNILFTLGLIAFSFTQSIFVAYILLFIVGFSLVSMFATVNTTIQHCVVDQMRGRVMSIYALAFMGLAPLGSFSIGYAADHLGPSLAIRIGASIALLYGIYYTYNIPSVKKAQALYDGKR
jgi:MFS family permease